VTEHAQQRTITGSSRGQLSRAGSDAIAKGAEIFAERWTPLIIRNVHVAPIPSVR
jgi:hypothetical protein